MVSTVATVIMQVTAEQGVLLGFILLKIIRTISVIIAVTRLLQFYRRLRPLLTPHAVIPKLIAIKGIVFLNILQTIIFLILNVTGAAAPNSHLTCADISFGIPSILVCGEMALFSLFNLHAYRLAPYKSDGGGGKTDNYRGGTLGVRALLMALNPMEIARGLVLAARYLVSNPPARDYNSVPLQQRVSKNSPPSSVPQAGYDAQSEIERAHSSGGVEYGHVERYTPV